MLKNIISYPHKNSLSNIAIKKSDKEIDESIDESTDESSDVTIKTFEKLNNENHETK